MTIRQVGLAGFGALMLTVATQAQAPAPADVFGTFCLSGVREVGSCFRFLRNQTFEYYLSYGGYDEVSEGTWRLEGGEVVLSTAAFDRKPSFVFKERRSVEGERHVILVETSAGRGLAGVDVRATCDGRRSEGYTQTYGYRTSCTTEPRELTIGIRAVGLDYQPAAVSDQPGTGTTLVFVFEPGDLGQKAFTGTRLRLGDGPSLTMTYRSDAVRDLDGARFVYRRSQQ